MEKTTRIRVYFRHPTATGGKWEQQAGITLKGPGATEAMQMVAESAFSLMANTGMAPEIALVPNGVSGPDDKDLEDDVVAVQEGEDVEKKFQERLVAALRAALPGADILTERKIGEDYQADIVISISKARLVVEIKRRRDPQTVRHAQDQIDRLARLGWAGIVVCADETDMAEIVKQIEERL